MDRQKKIYIVGALTFFLVSLFLLKPTLASINDLRTNNKRNQEKLQRLLDKLETLQSIDKDEIERRVDLVESVFPSKRPIIELISSLQQLSAEEEVEFSGIELRPGEIGVVPEDKSKLQFPISFKVKAQIDNLTSFITKLERTSPVMRIDTFELQFSSSDDETSLVNASLTVMLYYQPPPDTIGAVDKPLAMLTHEEVEVLKMIDNYRLYSIIEATSPIGKEDLFGLP